MSSHLIEATFAKPVVEVVKRSEHAPTIVKTEIKVTPRKNRFEEEATTL